MHRFPFDGVFLKYRKTNLRNHKVRAKEFRDLMFFDVCTCRLVLFKIFIYFRWQLGSSGPTPTPLSNYHPRLPQSCPREHKHEEWFSPASCWDVLRHQQPRFRFTADVAPWHCGWVQDERAEDLHRNRKCHWGQEGDRAPSRQKHEVQPRGLTSMRPSELGTEAGTSELLIGPMMN